MSGRMLSDSSFTKNRDIPVHRWVPWIAGFSSDFVDDCIEVFLGRKQRNQLCVMDPFAGVGTTLVSAIKFGFDTVGFEINPYAVLASRIKINSPALDLKLLNTYYKRYEFHSQNGYQFGRGTTPVEFVTRIPFFSPAVEKQVFGFLDFLQKVKHQVIADVFRLAFGSVMVSFSNYTYEPSLSSRPGAGKPLIEYADVHEKILRKLSEIKTDVQAIQNEIKTGPTIGKGQIYEMDFMESPSVLPARSVDLVVTSPPYMNNYHYVRNTRPQLFWLSLVGSRNDLRKLEEKNIGKYWQKVRDSKSISLVFEDKGLEDLLDRIRSTRTNKGAYGGPGWANYVASYVNDSYRFIKTLKRALNRGATAVIVIGNSIIQGHEIKVEHILADIGERLGLKVKGIELLRTKRVGASITKSSVRRGQTSKASLYECAVILQKR